VGSASRKLRGPAIPAADIGRIDAVLLSHDQQHGALWISGDTVLYDGVRSVADRVDVGTALLHLGGVQFPVTGPVRYSMTAAQAVEVCGLLRPHTAIPVHYEGWSHFRQGRAVIEQEFGRAPAEVREVVIWAPIGDRLVVKV